MSTDKVDDGLPERSPTDQEAINRIIELSLAPHESGYANLKRRLTAYIACVRASRATPDKCVTCGHEGDTWNAVTGLCEFDPAPQDDSIDFCGCECEFPATPNTDALCAYHGQRLIEWMDDPNRKPANIAFTAGNERQIAYRFEHAIVPDTDAREIERPNVICLCGSTRFIETFAIKTWELEREGNIVLGCTLLPMWYCNTPSHFGEATGTKEQCDELHKRKIDLADEVLVLNVGGYIGESTRSEIEYATRLGKPVSYLESMPLPAPPKGTTQ